MYTYDKFWEVCVMKKYSKSQREFEEKKIAIFICSIIASIMIFFIIFGTINTQAALNKISTKYYTSVRIKSGDTLWTIANDYITDEYADINEYIEEICTINHISKDMIHAGKYIVVPYYASDSTNRH